MSVSSGAGCTASNSVTTVVNPRPATPVVTPGAAATLCDDDSNSPLNLSVDTTGAGAGATILWNDFLETSSTQLEVHGSDIDFQAFGNPYDFSVTVTNSFGCSAISNAVNVTSTTCAPTFATLNMKLLLEGYYAGSGLMDNFSSGGCLFIDNVPGATANDADSIRISLVDPNSLTVLNTSIGIMHVDGTVSVTFPSSTVGNAYYLKVVHRNALETWSANPVTIATTTSYDFTTGPNKAYGSNMTQSYDAMGWMFYSGDISDANNLGLGLGYQDGVAEAQDYLDMENAVAIIKTGYVPEDLTGDGFVEAADYLIMENAVAAIRMSAHP